MKGYLEIRKNPLWLARVRKTSKGRAGVELGPLPQGIFRGGVESDLSKLNKLNILNRLIDIKIHFFLNSRKLNDPCLKN